MKKKVGDFVAAVMAAALRCGAKRLSRELPLYAKAVLAARRILVVAPLSPALTSRRRE
jgi:hypothetical protein